MTARSICSVRGGLGRSCVGGCCWARARGRGERAVLPRLDRRAEMSLSAKPSQDTEILWPPIGSVGPLPPPPLTSGRADGGSPELIGCRAGLGTPGRDWLSLSGPGLANRTLGPRGNLRRGLATPGSWLGKPAVRLVATPRTRQTLSWDWLRPQPDSEIAGSGCLGFGGEWKGLQREREGGERGEEKGNPELRMKQGRKGRREETGEKEENGRGSDGGGRGREKRDPERQVKPGGRGVGGRA